MIRPNLDEQRSVPTTPTGRWEVPASRAALETYPDSPRLGAIVAATICSVIAWGGWLIGPPGGWIVGAIGFPGTTILAYRLAPQVLGATRRGAIGVAGELAIGSILVADALIVSVIIIAAVLGSAGTAPVEPAASLVDAVGGLVASLVGGVLIGILSFIIGAIVIGIPIAIVVVPAALVWALAVRSLAQNGSAQ